MSDAIRPDYKPRQRRSIEWEIFRKSDRQAATRFEAVDAQGGNFPAANRRFAAWCSENGVNHNDYDMWIVRM